MSTAAIVVESPPGFIVREEAHKAAYENGFRIECGVYNGWLKYHSSTARGEIWIARSAAQQIWLLSISQGSVAAELGLTSVEAIVGPGFATFAFSRLHELYAALDRVYKLSVSLPDAPLNAFEKATANLPCTTEAERLTVERIGQALFRAALMEYWNGRCPLTGITDPALLRASHIVPWAECETDALRLDVHNGLLLSALWDAAFDAGLIGFADDGTVLCGDKLTAEAAASLHLDMAPALSALTDHHRQNLTRHRARHGFDCP
jgi:hypothetical protein